MSAPAAALEVAGVKCRGWMIFRVPPGTKRPHKSVRYSGDRIWGICGEPVEIERYFRRWPEANPAMDCFQSEPVDG
jgi:hypothetical protein